jgi:hypothetical protein
MDPKIGRTHLARKALFRRGIRQGQLAVADIEEALPPGSMTPTERWLLYYSLRAAEIEILGEPPPIVEEIEREIREGGEGPPRGAAAREERGEKEEEEEGRLPPV